LVKSARQPGLWLEDVAPPEIGINDVLRYRKATVDEVHRFAKVRRVANVIKPYRSAAINLLISQKNLLCGGVCLNILFGRKSPSRDACTRVPSEIRAERKS
jgi:hypothetical protein